MLLTSGGVSSTCRECEQALREQTITVKGQAQDIHAVCDSALGEAAAAIAAYTHQLWGGGEALEKPGLLGRGGNVQETLAACPSLRPALCPSGQPPRALVMVETGLALPLLKS